MSFSQEVRERSLVACARHCCICHQFCGSKIELHHIKHKSEGGTDSFDNCIPLCFNCHADQRSYDHEHPKGTKYTRSELGKHRDNWYARVLQGSIIVPDAAVAELDRNVFQFIKRTLPWDGIIRFARLHDFGADFPSRKLEEFHDFEIRRIDPNFEFFDTELEPLRAEFHATLQEFLNEVSSQTFYLDRDPELRGVPKEGKREDPDHYYRTIRRLNELGANVAESYDRLIKACRRKLGDD